MSRLQVIKLQGLPLGHAFGVGIQVSLLPVSSMKEMFCGGVPTVAFTT